MANAFKRATNINIGTAATRLGAYTVPANTTSTVIGLNLCNRSGAAITVDITLSDGTNTVYLLRSAPIPVGGALVGVGGVQKLVLQAGDSLFVQASAANSVDAVMSYLETT